MKFLQLTRQSQISKRNADSLLSFIKRLLPVPNTAPSTLNDLLANLDVVNYFEKSTVCIICQNFLAKSQLVCNTCPGVEIQHVAHIFDTNLSSLLKTIVERLIDKIEDYKKIIATGESVHYDIPFGKQYQQLLFKSRGQNIISLIIHIDGISLVKSTKLKLWLCSASIVEVPAYIRTQRKNIILLSMHIGYTEPNITIWLNSTLRKIKNLKEKGITLSLTMNNFINTRLKCIQNNVSCSQIKYGIH